MTWSLEPGPWREPRKPFPANPAEANARLSLASLTQIGFCPAAEGVPGGVPVGGGKENRGLLPGWALPPQDISVGHIRAPCFLHSLLKYLLSTCYVLDTKYLKYFSKGRKERTNPKPPVLEFTWGGGVERRGKWQKT